MSSGLPAGMPAVHDPTPHQEKQMSDFPNNSEPSLEPRPRLPWLLWGAITASLSDLCPDCGAGAQRTRSGQRPERRAVAFGSHFIWGVGHHNTDRPFRPAEVFRCAE